MPASVQLKEARDLYQDRREKLAKVFEEAKTTDDDGKAQTDFRLVKCLDIKDGDGKSIAVVEKVQEMNEEMNECYDNVAKLELAEKAEANLKDLDRKGTPIVHPGKGTPGENVFDVKTIGEIMVANDIYKDEWQKGIKSGRSIEIPEFSLAGLSAKATFLTTAGWAPESLRTGRVVLDAQRPIQIIDLIPAGSTTSELIVYMEETTFTNAAVETAEEAAFAEATLILTEKSSPVRKIAVFIPVTDEQLADEAQAQSYLNNRLPFMVNQRLDSQILVGDGTGVNLEGFLNVTGIQTQAKAADTALDAIYKAMDLVRVTGRAVPSGLIIHPTNWQPIRLLQTADGIYIWGHPAEQGPDRVWGVPVAMSDAITLGTALTGDFANFSELVSRSGMELKVSDSHSDFFIKGKQAIRASLRVALPVYRPAAFSTITGL